MDVSTELGMYTKQRVNAKGSRSVYLGKSEEEERKLAIGISNISNWARQGPK